MFSSLVSRSSNLPLAQFLLKVRGRILILLYLLLQILLNNLQLRLSYYYTLLFLLQLKFSQAPLFLGLFQSRVPSFLLFIRRRFLSLDPYISLPSIRAFYSYSRFLLFSLGYYSPSYYSLTSFLLGPFYIRPVRRSYKL